MTREKIAQAIEILKEKNIDLWLTFVRETDVMADPILDFILGTTCVWQSAFILTNTGKKIAIVGSLDVENIKNQEIYDEVIDYIGSIREELIKVLDRIKPQKIAINYSKDSEVADGLTYGMYLSLIDYLTNTPYQKKLISAEEIISALRGRKSQEEIKRIKEAIAATEKIFNQLTKFFKPELTEIEIARFIKKETLKLNLGFAWNEAYCPSVYTGPQEGGAHSGPTKRKIEPGHILNIDFGVKKENYVSDLQRVWYFRRKGEKEAPEEVEKAFQTVREAIQISGQAIKPGKQGWEIDKLARNYILSQGFEEYPHALGHQVGRTAHDGSALLAPRWERYGQRPFEKLEKGQVFTLEPRINLIDYGVVSVEEIILITENGTEFLSHPQKELIHI
ncbi:MAG: M24 family metallopeptidase [Candidatus Aminicenantia bacterium]